ncbi:MAG: polyphosphate kinase 1 [Oceanococcaceae bacterium]
MSTDTDTLPPLEHFLQPQYFFNRELSLLEFNHRVLAQARDSRIPLLERLKFLCISCSNLDEFFEVRVAGLHQRLRAGASVTGFEARSPLELIDAVGKRAHTLVADQYRTLNEVLIPRLAENEIRFLRRTKFTGDARVNEWLQSYFRREVLPILSPIGLDLAHPFPRVLNKSLNFIVALEGKDAFGRNADMAVVQAPRALPRLIHVPPEVCGHPHDFVFLSSVIHAYVDELFPGMTACGCYQFRVTRNSDLFVDEEEVDDLMDALEGELAYRDFGDAVRLEVAHNCPDHMVQFLLEMHKLDAGALFQVNGPVNLARLMKLADMVDRPELKYRNFSSFTPPVLARGTDMFAATRIKSVLLHHPYDSFAPVVDFLRQAAKDPQVLVIKQTLYRTGADSSVVEALVDAARAGKEVTVVIELRARFDEAENIDLAERLQDAGAHVVYGVVGHKTHAKMILVVRREGTELRQYVHLGTGNYHPRTAKLYTDYGLFSADREVCDDVAKLFLQLTSLGRLTKLHKLLSSPFTLHKGVLAKIEREITHAQAGKPARLILKMNQCVEAQAVAALYRASVAGVKVDLIVRGMTAVRPGLPGVSENVRLISVIGRFLEHTRVFYFENGGQPEVYLTSADFMERIFFRRVEVMFPVEEPRSRDRVVRELKLYLADESQGWLLQSDGRYERVVPKPGRRKVRAAQTRLLETQRR